MSRCTKSMQKIASLYIYRYIFTSQQLHSIGVCNSSVFSYGRQASEYIQRHARGDTRQKNTGSRHLQNTHTNTHTHTGTDVTLSSLASQYTQAHSLSPPPFVCSNDLKSWGIGRCCSLPVLRPRHLQPSNSLPFHSSCRARSHLHWADLCRGCTIQDIWLFLK